MVYRRPIKTSYRRTSQFDVSLLRAMPNAAKPDSSADLENASIDVPLSDARPDIAAVLASADRCVLPSEMHSHSCAVIIALY